MRNNDHITGRSGLDEVVPHIDAVLGWIRVLSDSHLVKLDDEKNSAARGRTP
jgi:hypothetical protein